MHKSFVGTVTAEKTFNFLVKETNDVTAFDKELVTTGAIVAGVGGEGEAGCLGAEVDLKAHVVEVHGVVEDKKGLV